MMTDRERLEQIRREWFDLAGDVSDENITWLLDRLDALGRGLATLDAMTGVWGDNDCVICQWPSGTNDQIHDEDCVYAWAKAVYGEPDAAGGEERR